MDGGVSDGGWRKGMKHGRSKRERKLALVVSKPFLSYFSLQQHAHIFIIDQDNITQSQLNNKKHTHNECVDTNGEMDD